MYFSNGEFYTKDYSHETVFGDDRTKQPSGHKLNSANKVGLNIEVPDYGYAVLHFDGDTEDFVFKGGRNYEVEVINRAEAIDFRHFGFFYKIVHPKPKQRLVPISEQGFAPVLGSVGIFCKPGLFGKSDYPMPKFKTKR